MVAGFSASAVAARLVRASDVRREHGFAFLLAGGPIVTGVVDVLATEDDGAALVLDYKSDPLEGAEPEAIVEATYGVQRRLYALAALEAGAPAGEVVHVFLEDPALPAVRAYDAADAPALAAELAAAAAPLVAGEYPVAAVPHRGLCATCPGRAGLCSYPPELTDREPTAVPG
jgi:ATP-dependent helicase/nuclease subunit A